MNYIYTQRNNLKEPQNYMYSTFSGKEFLEQYINSRSNNIQEFLRDKDEIGKGYGVKIDFILNYLNHILNLDQISQLIASEKINIDKVQLIEPWSTVDKRLISDITDKADPPKTSKTINIRIVIIDLIVALLINEFNDMEKERLNKIVQRFEVTKKLYESYNLDIRSGSGSFELIQPYWLLAVLLGLYYSKTKKLKYLSTLLKISDLLCSISVNKVSKEVPKNGMVLLLALELTFITSLTKSKGVSIDTK
jgi:hypothetical protein